MLIFLSTSFLSSLGLLSSYPFIVFSLFLSHLGFRVRLKSFVFFIPLPSPVHKTHIWPGQNAHTPSSLSLSLSCKSWPPSYARASNSNQCQPSPAPFSIGVAPRSPTSMPSGSPPFLPPLTIPTNSGFPARLRHVMLVPLSCYLTSVLSPPTQPPP